MFLSTFTQVVQYMLVFTKNYNHNFIPWNCVSSKVQVLEFFLNFLTVSEAEDWAIKQDNSALLRLQAGYCETPVQCIQSPHACSANKWLAKLLY